MGFSCRTTCTWNLFKNMLWLLFYLQDRNRLLLYVSSITCSYLSEGVFHIVIVENIVPIYAELLLLILQLASSRPFQRQRIFYLMC
jgi:hypothetical protein